MAVSLVFHGSEQTPDHQVDITLSDENQIEITINEGRDIDHFIHLDVSTAIKFSKELRRLIAKAKEADNG
jgi:hypothetical protein